MLYIYKTYLYVFMHTIPLFFFTFQNEDII